MSEHARTLLAQHVQTTKLLGVDFHPLGTIPSALSPSSLGNQSPSSIIEPKPFCDPDQASAPQQIQNTIDPASIRACHESQGDPQSKLDALETKYESDAPHAAFATSFTNIVFGEGDPNADLMFIGEAPGQQEDQSGRPFVGKAGQLLERMIHAMGLSRDTVYITNVLKTRPPNNATPTQDEALRCAPYLCEQIRIINPKVIVTLGLLATHLLLDSSQPMRSMRGRFHPFPTKNPPFADLSNLDLMPTYHPAFLLRSYTEDNRRKVWSDLQQVMTKLGLQSL